MPTIFTRIVNGEIPCHRLYEDDRSLVFLDLRPINPGHALVIPKEEIDYLFDVPDDLLQHLMLVAKKVARALGEVAECEKVGVIVAGLEVPHAHIHLVPINSVGDIDFSKAKDATQDELAATAAAIRAHLANPES